MIYSLTGILQEKTQNEAVIVCGGVGYLATIPASCASRLPAVGSEATLYTCMNVSENDVALFGFSSAEERSMFRLLTGVSGVGPKVGVAILSAMAPQRIVLAISAGDHKAFTAAQGVGPKLGQRIVLELKDKVAKGMTAQNLLPELADVPPAEADAVRQAIAGLTALGYTPGEAAAAVGHIDPGLPTAEIIRLALRSMGGGR